MTPTAPMPPRSLVELNAEGLRALIGSLGAADAARFLSQFGPGRGDYTAERDALLGDPDLESAIAWVQRAAGVSDE